MRKRWMLPTLLLCTALGACNTSRQMQGRVWEDVNGNGIQDEGEPGIPGVEVNLIVRGNAIITRTTDENGDYFAELTWDEGSPLDDLVDDDGDFKGKARAIVQVIPPDGYKFTLQDQGDDRKKDSDVNQAGVSLEYRKLENGVHDDAGLIRISDSATSKDDDNADVGSGASVAQDIPPVTNPYELSVNEEEPAECDFFTPAAGREAVLTSGENGFELQLYAPLGLKIVPDGAGSLTAQFNEREDQKVEVLDFLREGDTVTILLRETRMSEDAPEGCSRTYAVVYRFGNADVLDFLSRVPTSGKGETNVENPNLEMGDGFFTLTGQFVNMEPGQVYHVWTEISAAELTYDLTPIIPDQDGNYVVVVEKELPDGSHVTILVLANGVKVIGTSGSAPSSE